MSAPARQRPRRPGRGGCAAPRLVRIDRLAAGTGRRGGCGLRQFGLKFLLPGNAWTTTREFVVSCAANAFTIAGVTSR